MHDVADAVSTAMGMEVSPGSSCRTTGPGASRCRLAIYLHHYDSRPRCNRLDVDRFADACAGDRAAEGVCQPEQGLVVAVCVVHVQAASSQDSAGAQYSEQ